MHKGRQAAQGLASRFQELLVLQASGDCRALVDCSPHAGCVCVVPLLVSAWRVQPRHPH